MAYVKLKEEGKQFIRKVCSGNGKTLLEGKSSQKINDTSSKLYNPNGVLPFSSPKVLPSKIWYSNAKHNGANISTNAQLGEALIAWFEKYGQLFEMDANIIAAQAYAESGYILWNYALTSTASGISQFTSDTLYTVIVDNKFSSVPEYRFTNEEIMLINNGISGDKKQLDSYSVSTETGKKNRAIIHQNICDNPEIMIKAQYNYMKFISKRCDGLASSALFGYNRGPYIATPSYTQSIANAKNPERGKDYELEGIGYVYKIFQLLGNPDYAPTKGWFGYSHLNLNEPFNSYNAEVAESNFSDVEIQSFGKYYVNGFKYPADYLLTKYFTYYDAISMTQLMKPEEPERKNYDNTPSEEYLNNLINIGSKIYDPLCDFIGKKVIVNSAYRGAYLNNVSKGSENSQHKRGEAIDIDAPSPNTNSELFYYIANNLNFDQLIWEEGNAFNPQWIHVSLVKNGTNRKRISLYNPSWAGNYRHVENIAQFNTLKAQLYPTGYLG
jgi:zinc D-Ala-D-Ala carboxypeptidase